MANVSNTYIAAHITWLTFSTIGSNQKWSSNCFFDFLSVFILDNSRDDAFAILFNANKLGVQLNKDTAFLDMGPDDLFGVMLSKQDAICLRNTSEISKETEAIKHESKKTYVWFGRGIFLARNHQGFGDHGSASNWSIIAHRHQKFTLFCDFRDSEEVVQLKRARLKKTVSDPTRLYAINTNLNTTSTLSGMVFVPFIDDTNRNSIPEEGEGSDEPSRTISDLTKSTIIVISHVMKGDEGTIRDTHNENRSGIRSGRHSDLLRGFREVGQGIALRAAGRLTTGRVLPQRYPHIPLYIYISANP